ncbi:MULTISPECIES: zinc-dependent alcohol dehydrogenase family protein [unclassified Sphingobium]|uniref:zinc-dependent alcohol dehydrogenase family protein n=1 Tax=unclassified Sphingobium TaxID=2611147 RepID=UPI0007DA3213|nr:MULTISPECIES: zinc-dependent alcohol dehydrogenase family protein [unclassified Sphingobium]OAP33582.1 hypothetical protein A8O16_03170 [Sphingobium sp. 20006FA]
MPKVISFHRTGGPEVLSYAETAFGEPGPGELRIRVAAIGLNRAELLYRAGRMGQPAGFPATLGSEGAGTVEAVGQDVEGFTPGDRIATIPGFSTLPGFSTEPTAHACAVYGEKAFVPAAMAVKIPDGMSFVEASSIWMQYATAYSGLVDAASLRAGQFALITAASASTGIAAIQIAKLLGATPIAATRSRAKAEVLGQQGAAHVIVTGESDLAGQVRRITGDAGANAIFDPVAGAGVAQLVEAAAHGGHIILYGIMDDRPTTIDVAQAMAKALHLHFPSQFTVSLDPEKRERMKRLVLGGLATGVLKPVIDRVFPFDQMIEAHRYLEGQAHVGKVVVAVE